MLCRKDRSAEHIEESMHLCFHFIAILPARMMQTCRKLDRELMRGRRHEGIGDLRGSGKCISRHPTGAQFVAKGCDVLIGIVLGEQRDGLLRSIRWRFPENWQVTDNRSRLFQ